MAKYIDIESFTNFINKLVNESRVDVVEVVRCKDCKNFKTIASKYYCNEYGGYVTEDDYCSRCVKK